MHVRFLATLAEFLAHALWWPEIGSRSFQRFLRFAGGRVTHSLHQVRCGRWGVEMDLTKSLFSKSPRLSFRQTDKQK